MPSPARCPNILERQLLSPGSCTGKAAYLILLDYVGVLRFGAVRATECHNGPQNSELRYADLGVSVATDKRKGKTWN